MPVDGVLDLYPGVMYLLHQRVTFRGEGEERLAGPLDGVRCTLDDGEQLIEDLGTGPEL